jgi:hypothetical protein
MRARAVLARALLCSGALGLFGMTSAQAIDCLLLSDVAANFKQVYPTGGPMARYRGEEARAVIRALPSAASGRQVAFLYSGDGPVTGARGRYLYLILGPKDCIRSQDWIDGAACDRAVSGL